MVDEKRKKVPPDGGWGYVVVFATAMMGFLLFPTIQNFGLLFRPIFSELNLPASAVTTIVNVNSGSGLVFGMFHGPLSKIFGFRKYSIIGGAMVSVGLLATSLSYSFMAFIIFYGILNSIGFSITHSGFSCALNSYFSKKRTAAIGIAYTIAGIGSIITPLILSQAIDSFGARDTAFIVSGVVLNLIVAAMFLQPVEWHYKYEGEAAEEKPLTDFKTDVEKCQDEENKPDDDADVKAPLKSVASAQ